MTQTRPSLNSHSLDASSLMVSWFIDQAKAPLKVEERVIGGHRYFLCLSGLEKDGHTVTVVGRGNTKLEAATKCVGEWFERKAAFEFFGSIGSQVLAQKVSAHSNGSLSLSSEKEVVPFLHMEFWTTNGWAVHTNFIDSLNNSFSEALERHLLVSSFLRWGWEGFIEIGKSTLDDAHFQSCISRFKTTSHSAGFAICKDNGTTGLSFGHFCELTDKIPTSPRWAHALYESIDKFKTDFTERDLNDPIAVDVLWYLQNETAAQVATSATMQELINFDSCYLYSEDLKEKWALPFPLSASFIFGGDLMPLFLPKELTQEGIVYIKKLSNRMGFTFELPERIPVL